MIDYKEVQKIAENMEMSPHIWAKRKLYYRISEGLSCCALCKHFVRAPFARPDQGHGIRLIRLQCRLIGVKDCNEADVLGNFVCDGFKGPEKKIQEDQNERLF